MLNSTVCCNLRSSIAWCADSHLAYALRLRPAEDSGKESFAGVFCPANRVFLKPGFFDFYSCSPIYEPLPMLCEAAFTCPSDEDLFPTGVADPQDMKP
jgi:hypothetical protein